MSRVPDLFIVGAPKCGTTSLYDYLNGHPQLFMSPVKEPGYFSRDLDFDPIENSYHYGRDWDRYLALFKGATDQPLLGEGSTRYLYSRDAPGLIKQASKDARIVAMVRNPVDMIRSLHAHKLSAGTEDIADLRAAIDAEDDRHAGRRIPPLSNPKLATYRDRALFAEQLSRWFDEFGRDRVQVTVLEDMIRQPQEQFEDVLKFLDVDPAYRPESFAVRNQAHGTRSLRLRRMTHSQPAQWLVRKQLPRILGDARANEVVRVFRESPIRRKKVKHEPMDPALRRELETYFEPDVARLSQLLGRDLGALWFNRPSSAQQQQLDVATG